MAAITTLVTIIGFDLLNIPNATQNTHPKKLMSLKIDIFVLMNDNRVKAVAIHPTIST